LIRLVTVVTVAFGKSQTVSKWVEEWSKTGVSCVISDNGNQIPDGLCGNAKVLPFTGNTGFGAGINRAVRESDTPLILITNPDTLPETLGSLAAITDYHTRGSLTGGCTVDSSGKEMHSSGIWPTIDWLRPQVFKPAGTLWRGDRIDWLQGSLILAHRDDFLQIGGFSAGYPLFFEDVDLCAKAEKQGMKVDICRESRFIHDEGSGSVRVGATRLACFHWGMLEYFRNHDPLHAGTARRLLISKCILRFIANAAVNIEAARGYYLGLHSIISGNEPGLPGALDGR